MSAPKASPAEELILRAEREAGCRFDDPEGGNVALTLIAGALGRETGLHRFDERDDFAAGVLLLHEASPRGRAERAAMNAFCRLVTGGVDPESAADFVGRKKR